MAVNPRLMVITTAENPVVVIPAGNDCNTGGRTEGVEDVVENLLPCGMIERGLYTNYKCIIFIPDSNFFSMFLLLNLW